MFINKATAKLWLTYLNFYLICRGLEHFILYYFYCIFSLPFIPLKAPSPLQSPHCCPCPWVLCPPLPPSPPTPDSCQPALCESATIVLASSACSLESAREWSHTYLSFSDWLISLSIMVTRSTHAVAKGKFFFFFAAKQNSTHLLTDTWAASLSRRL